VTVVVWIFALLAAAIHIVVFVWETLLFQRPGVHQGVFGVPATDVPAVRLWAFNVGFYNLFLASGQIVGVIAWSSGDALVGRTLVIYICMFMFLGSIALFASDRLAMSRRPRGTGVRGALAEGISPLIALVAALT
jgi:putative membrane protein